MPPPRAVGVADQGQDAGCHRGFQATAGPVHPFRQTRSCPAARGGGEVVDTSAPAHRRRRNQPPTGVTNPVLRRLRTPAGSGGCGTSATASLALTRASNVARRQGREEEWIDVGHADLDAHGTCRPSRRRAGAGCACRARSPAPRRDRSRRAAARPAAPGDVAERRQATQAFSHQRRLEQLVEFPRHVDTTAQQIGAGPVAAILQHACGLGMQRRARRRCSRRDHGGPAHRRPATTIPGAANERCAARRRRRIAAEAFVGAQPAQRDLDARLVRCLGTNQVLMPSMVGRSIASRIDGRSRSNSARSTVRTI